MMKEGRKRLGTRKGSTRQHVSWHQFHEYSNTYCHTERAIALSFSPPVRRSPSTGSFKPVTVVVRSLVSFGVPLSSSRPASRQALATGRGHLLDSGSSSIFLAQTGFGPKAPADGNGDLHFGRHMVISFPRGGFAARSTVSTDAIPSKLPARQGLCRAINAGGAFSTCSPVPTGCLFVTAA